MARKTKYTGPKKRVFHPRQRSTRSMSEAMGQFVSVMDGEYKLMIPRLWKAWPDLMGELAEFAKPLGHRKKTLILAAEDSVAAQELSYFAPEILERINLFFGEEVFDKVLFELLNGRVPLDGYKLQRTEFKDAKIKKPGKLGGLKDKFDPESAVGRCYLKYVRLFEKS
ncbi:DUF721 domain-containing protein [Maridesulfovibrio hydrothermalis]|uniref:DUF721 domain-containing protein n=1 Tax=Maridesulfovibrio hydrothermalis AM13 = DSM 14728 TaxID=1121451 RepID=L0RAN3_9BACT|nr:DUF721 domain-containing protein [Maridesulfovibrio hydrothermalis]CCO23814.1 conserved protein of unknown function [Maridesulfovibrio hydrothermalis AM13 = DSM 14728]